MPSSSARRIGAMDSAWSWGPHSPPPTAHAPTPTVVMASPLEPSERVASVMIRLSLPERSLRKQQHFAGRLTPFERGVRLGRGGERELVGDPSLQSPTPDPAQDLAGAPAQLVPRHPA